MIARADPRAPQTDSPGLALVPRRDMEKMPPELVTAVLEFLDPDDLRRAGTVSRLWRESAWCAGLTLSARITCSRSSSESQSDMLDDAVQHALRNNRRLSLSVTLIAFFDSECSEVKSVVSSIVASLPVLVYLSASVSRPVVPGVLSALCQPAPRLQEFGFRVEEASVQCRFGIPDSLFGGVAPQLRRLMLDRVPVGQALVPAFAQVIALHLRCSHRIVDIESIDYSEHFPRLDNLHLQFHTIRGRAAPQSFKFSGLRLHKLTIDDYDHCTIIPATIRSIDVSQLPVFEHIGTTLHPDDPLWTQQDLGAVSLRLTRLTRGMMRDSDVSVLLVPEDRLWRRTYHIKLYGKVDNCPIVALPGLFRVGQRVTYLRINDEHLVAFLEAAWPDLAALRALRVDCHRDGGSWPTTWPPARRLVARSVRGRVPGAPNRRYVRCPALETLKIVACDPAMTLASREVVLLGAALDQCEREEQERAALVLVGVQLTEPANDALPRKAFSSVVCRAPGSPLDRDGGLWDEEW